MTFRFRQWHKGTSRESSITRSCKNGIAWLRLSRGKFRASKTTSSRTARRATNQIIRPLAIRAIMDQDDKTFEHFENEWRLARFVEVNGLYLLSCVTGCR